MRAPEPTDGASAPDCASSREPTEVLGAVELERLVIEALAEEASPADDEAARRVRWLQLRARIASERARAPAAAAASVSPAALEWAALAICALVLAGALVRFSPRVSVVLASGPASVAWLLPLLFLGFGALVALLSLPLLRAAVASGGSFRTDARTV